MLCTYVAPPPALVAAFVIVEVVALAFLERSHVVCAEKRLARYRSRSMQDGPVCGWKVDIY